MNGRNAEQITEKPLLKAETERLILDEIRESDKEDYFHNISHDRKVLETFICRYADTLEEFDFSAYPGRRDVYAIRLKETGRLIGFWDKALSLSEAAERSLRGPGVAEKRSVGCL